MDGCAGRRSCLPPCLQRGEEMKPRECVSILPLKESPSVPFSKDGALLAVTLLLALTASCLSVLAFCRVAALQAELGSLRAELQQHQAERLPGPPQAGAAAPGAAVRETPAVTSALKVSLQQAAAAPGVGSPRTAASRTSDVFAVTWGFSLLRGSSHHPMQERATPAKAAGTSVPFRVQKKQVSFRHRGIYESGSLASTGVEGGLRSGARERTSARRL